MTSIYTRTGDQGETGLFGGGRVPKDDARVDAYGEVDELNAVLGVARAAGQDPGLEALLKDLQDQLFTVGSVLATPQGSKAASYIPQIQPEWVDAMERAIDDFDTQLPKMTHFILPGGTAAASSLHVARTVCRRAERRVIPLVRDGQVTPAVVVYLNRLSDLLFTMARVANARAGVQDVLWIPNKP
ncbi:MAG: cob(I)yrinic acid a,c-diamide adenosyltransferase [Myxococcota bacterium]|nr:cob(I)yrinic acid a,c-diamide adenosyltransferase [Myxococcota bacterium]